MICAQDIHFTQFYSVPTYLNPAFTGLNNCTKAASAYRNQWSGVKTGYSTYLGSFDTYFSNYNSGAGLLLAQDVAGSSPLKTTLVNLNYAYEIVINRKLVSRIGTQMGLQQKKMDVSRLFFADQVVRKDNNSSVENFGPSVTFLDIGMGALVYGENVWAGFCGSHLNKPNESLTVDNSFLPIKLSFHAGGKIKVNQSHRASNEEYIVPVLHYQMQNEFKQIQCGGYYLREPLSFGLMYRGNPFKKSNYPNYYSNNDAICILVGISSDYLSFGYSFDATVSRLSILSYGTHEITLVYKSCNPKKRKAKHTVPCPKF